MRSKNYPRGESAHLGSLNEPVCVVAKRIEAQIRRREWREIDPEELVALLTALQRHSIENFDRDHSYLGGYLISGKTARLWIEKISNALSECRGSGPQRSRAVQEANDRDEGGLGFWSPYKPRIRSTRETRARLVEKLAECELLAGSREKGMKLFRDWLRERYSEEGVIHFPPSDSATQREKTVQKCIRRAAELAMKDLGEIKRRGKRLTRRTIQAHFHLTARSLKRWGAEVRESDADGRRKTVI